MSKKIYIAAGGTGGHINAALSVGEVFSKSHEVCFLSGTRYLDYQLFKNKNVIHLESKPLRTKNPFKLGMNLIYNLMVFCKILMMYLKNRPEFIVGAGGYICGPTLMAGKIIGIPIFIIEQNAVVGMTNKILSKFANKIFTNFKETKGITDTTKVIRTGNPIRANIKTTENILESDKFKILVFGGSLGATQINDAIHSLLEDWSGPKLEIFHQVGKNNIIEVKIENSDINYEQVEYIDNMQEAYSNSNIIISRAGASTVSELRVVKKPSIIIPYPAATDNHQYYNALELKEENNFYVDVLNQKLREKELAQEMISSIKDIIENNKFDQKDHIHENASMNIEKEIIKYVRN